MQTITAYRFADRSLPGAFRPNLYQWRWLWFRPLHHILMYNSRFCRFRAYLHSDGLTIASPYISLGLDLYAMRTTTDPMLETIIYELAPDIAVFEIPMDRLIFPEHPLARRETEVIFEGNDLEQFLVRWDKNPFLDRDTQT